jgi:hypothetical protein
MLNYQKNITSKIKFNKKNRYNSYRLNIQDIVMKINPIQNLQKI